LHLDHNREERIIHRLRRTDPDYRFPVATLDCETSTLQRGAQIDPCCAICVACCEANLKILA
jgi:hypothetical protein